MESAAKMPEMVTHGYHHGYHVETKYSIVFKGKDCKWLPWLPRSLYSIGNHGNHDRPNVPASFSTEREGKGGSHD